MITATCKNEKCQQNGVVYNFEENESFVVCGCCNQPCELKSSNE